MYKSLIFIMVLLWAILCPNVVSVSMAANMLAYTDDYTTNPDYVRDSLEIQKLRNSQDLSGLVILGDKIQTKWGELPNKNNYYALSEDIASAMASTLYKGVSRRTQFHLARKYALLALSHSNVPVDVSFDLLTSTQSADVLDLESGVLSQTDLEALRREHAKLWLSTWQSICTEIDTNYNEKTSVALLAQAKIDALYMMAGSKESIEAYKRVRIMSTSMNEQRQLRLLKSTYQYTLITYLGYAYSYAPYDEEELRNYLETYVSDNGLQAQILAAVEKKRSNRAKSGA